MSPSPRDHEARTAEVGDVYAFDETTVHQARLTVAANSSSPQEAAEFMRMLGIHPSQQDDPAYGTGHPNLPTSAGRHMAHPLNPSLTNPHTPPRILHTPPERNFGTQFPSPNPSPLAQLRQGQSHRKDT